MKTVYFEGIWKEIITPKGFHLFAERGFKVKSYLIDPHWQKADNLDGVDLVIATKPDLEILEKAQLLGIPAMFYAVFPDLITGWDYEKNTYGNNLDKNFEDRISLAGKVLVNSQYTRKLLLSRADTNLNLEVCYLGVDSKTIATVTGQKKIKSDRKRVLWNHMWRKEKGFTQALSMVFSLAQKYPEVDFIIGRKEFWGGRDLPELKKQYQDYLIQIKQKGLTNIYFQENIEAQEKYWDFLGTVDVGFSCARHETFGIGMLEQQAAGIACVVPNIEAYPEIHTGAKLVPLQNIEEAVEQLILDEVARAQVTRSGQENAGKYTIEKFVGGLYSHMNEVLS